MGRKRTACQRCAGIKTLCNKEQPCSRCKRLNLSCLYDNPPVSEAKPEISPERPRNRAEHKRSTTGCVNCKRRRKKCDEQVPTCGDCRRLGLACQQRSQDGTSQQRPGSAQSPSAEMIWEVAQGSEVFERQQKSPSPSQQGYEYSVPSDGLDELLPMFQDHDATPSFLDWIALMDDDVSMELARRDTLHMSSALVVLPEDRATDQPSLATLFPVTALNNLTGVTSQALNGWTVGEKHLLNHFLQVVSRALVVVHDNENPFLLEIVPLAFHYAPVRHSLVALAACHLSKVYPDFQSNVLDHRSYALQGLKAELEAQGGVESALATTLMLCLLEICEGNSRKWILHLHGAKALMAQYSHDGPDSSIAFLFDLYDFLCCVTAITSNESPTPFSSPLNLHVDGYQHSNRHPIHSLYGVARDLYETLSHVNQLASHRASRYDTLQSEAMFLSRATEIELLLQGWMPPEGEDKDWDLREVTAVALAIQWACLMRLHQITYGSDIAHPKVQTAVENILSAVSIIRPGSKAEAHILFPLFMAGIGSSNKANRLTVEYRLNIMETTIGFGNITGAHKILDTVWQRMNQREESIEWELLMVTEYAGVVLF